MKKKSVAILFLFFYMSGFGQILLDSSNFDFSEEQALLNDFKLDHTFDLLFLIDLAEEDLASREKHRTDYFAFLQTLEGKIGKKKNKKIANVIYEAIHDQYFGKYIDNPQFSQIFLTKEYNCVTATALYAIALDYLKIPYEIREMPTHVYLMVYPESDKVLFETTAPQAGAVDFKERHIREYKEYLIASKMITQQEADDEDFFNKHYLADSSITLKQLAGIHYYNNSILHVESEDYLMATQQMEKALVLYDSEYIKEWLNMNMITLLGGEIIKLSNEDYCDYLTRFYCYNKTDESIEELIVEDFALKAVKIMEDKNGIEDLKKLADCLMQKNEADSIAVEFEYTTNLLLAEYYYNALETNKALECLTYCYKKENNKHLNIYIKSIIVNNLVKMSDAERGLDSAQHYLKTFPFLDKDADFEGYRAWCNLKMIWMHFELNESVDALKWLGQFKENFKPEADVYYPEEMIGRGFGAASAYYVREEVYDKAISYLEEGLVYSPNCLELKRKLKVLNEFLANKK